MNYHIKHHMFPMVSSYALSALQAELKADMPPAYNDLWEGYRAIISALIRNAKNPAWNTSGPRRRGPNP